MIHVYFPTSVPGKYAGLILDQMGDECVLVASVVSQCLLGPLCPSVLMGVPAISEVFATLVVSRKSVLLVCRGVPLNAADVVLCSCFDISRCPDGVLVSGW